jgi:hypothetical protein
MPKTITKKEMSVDELLKISKLIVRNFGKIDLVVQRFENEENYNSLAAIEEVAKIVREVRHA